MPTVRARQADSLALLLEKPGTRMALTRQGVVLVDEGQPCDFGIALLVDVQERRHGSLFLRTLHDLTLGEERDAGDAAARRRRDDDAGKRAEDLKKWTGSGSLLRNAAEWLGFAVVRFPMRVIVVADEADWGGELPPPGIQDEFLKRRLCWMPKVRLTELIEKTKDESGIAGEIGLRWLRHVLGATRGPDPQAIRLEFDRLQGVSDRRENASRAPDTVPQLWRTRDVDFEKPSKTVWLHLEKPSRPAEPEHLEIRIGEPDGNPPQHVLAVLRRHEAAWSFHKTNGWIPTESVPDDFGSPESPPLVYTEALSGSLSYFLTVKDAIEHPDEPRSRETFVDIGEVALTRIGIVDERFQEWAVGIGQSGRAGLALQRVVPAFWKDFGEYNQIQPKDTFGFAKIRLEGEGPVAEMASLRRKRKDPFLADGDPSGRIDLDVLIVHQGILDKWGDGGALTPQLRSLRKRVPYLVVTSGRGRPDKVPWGVRFLPYAGLDNCMNGNQFEKLLLLRQLHSLGGEL